MSRRKRVERGKRSRRQRPVADARRSVRDRDAARFGRGMVYVLVGAAVLKAVVLLETLSIPLYKDFLLLDSKRYKAMAETIASGDWIAGTEAYSLGPLYAYFLAVLQMLFGGDTLVIYVVQQLLGLASLALTGWLGYRFFGVRAGIAGAVLMALYAPVAMMELKVMASTLAVFLALLGVVALVRVRESGGAAKSVLAGVILGAACLARPNTLLFCPVAVAWLAWPGASARGAGVWLDRKRITVAAFAGVGILLGIAPATARNFYVEGEPILISSQGGITFYQANNPLSQGTYVAIPGFTGSQKTQSQESKAIAERETGHALTRSEVGRFWFRKGLRHILDDPLWALSLAAEKGAYWTGSQEFSTEYVLLTERRITRSLWLLPLPFAVLLGFAAIGVRARRFDVRAALIAAFIAVNLVSVMIFYFSSRYRLAAVPFLCVFGGAGVSLLVERYRANEALGRWLRLALPGVVVFGLSVIPWFPDYEMQAANQWFNMGNEYFYAKDYENAVRFYRRALRDLDGRAKVHHNLGITYKVLERWPEALREFDRVLEIDPSNEAVLPHREECLARMRASP